MNDKFITYETSLVLKSIKFDVPNTYHYDNRDTKNPQFFGLNVVHDLISPAPTQITLHTWLIDKYNITIYVIDDFVYGHNVDMGDSHFYIKNRHDNMHPKNDYVSYVDALEAGLQFALHLI